MADVNRKNNIIYWQYREKELKRLNWLEERLKGIKEESHVKGRIFESEDELLVDLRYNDGLAQVRLYIDILIDDNFVLIDWFRDDSRKEYYKCTKEEKDLDAFFEKMFMWIGRAKESVKRYVLHSMNNLYVEDLVKVKIERLINFLDDDLYGRQLYRESFNNEGMNHQTCGEKRQVYYCDYVRHRYGKRKCKKIVLIASDVHTIADIIEEDIAPEVLDSKLDLLDTYYYDEEYEFDNPKKDTSDLTRKQREIYNKTRKQAQKECFRNVLKDYEVLYDIKARIDDNIVIK